MVLGADYRGTRTAVVSGTARDAGAGLGAGAATHAIRHEGRMTMGRAARSRRQAAREAGHPKRKKKKKSPPTRLINPVARECRQDTCRRVVHQAGKSRPSRPFPTPPRAHQAQPQPEDPTPVARTPLKRKSHQGEGGLKPLVHCPQGRRRSCPLSVQWATQPGPLPWPSGFVAGYRPAKKVGRPLSQDVTLVSVGTSPVRVSRAR